MSAYEVKDALVEQIKANKYEFIVVNFANGDMVGHTGVYDAIRKAVFAVDNCVKDVVETAKQNGYEIIIIADHGNADHAVNNDGTPNTAHSLNPVPFIVISDRIAEIRSGRLADVAPSVLTLMGIDIPEEMKGESLVKL
jgi:2,3-bisphosphoglycerate-independent phosphoglycerate mutase